jgi:hypothetical protein
MAQALLFPLFVHSPLQQSTLTQGMTFRIVLLLGCPVFACSQSLTQWVGSTQCGNEARNMHTLDYSKGDDLTKCAAGVLPLEKTHIFYTEVECVGGG